MWAAGLRQWWRLDVHPGLHRSIPGGDMASCVAAWGPSSRTWWVPLLQAVPSPGFHTPLPQKPVLKRFAVSHVVPDPPPGCVLSSSPVVHFRLTSHISRADPGLQPSPTAKAQRSDLVMHFGYSVPQPPPLLLFSVLTPGELMPLVSRPLL